MTIFKNRNLSPNSIHRSFIEYTMIIRCYYGIFLFVDDSIVCHIYFFAGCPSFRRRECALINSYEFLCLCRIFVYEVIYHI
jgi:hypothetical protein